MQQADSDRIKDALEIKLPGRHARFLRNYNFKESQDFLMVDANLMIFENNGVRNDDAWDENFLIVGNDGCGNPLCLRLAPPFEELEKVYRTFEE